MEIVKLSAEDWEEYKTLRLRALKEDPQAFGTTYQKNIAYPKAEWQRRLASVAKGETNWLLFARENNKLVGMIGAFIEEDVEGTATIFGVYVPKEERGRGISIKLMEEILKELSKKSIFKKVKLMVSKNQLPAIGLYKKFGFKQVGIEHFKMGDGNIAEELVMERPLPYV